MVRKGFQCIIASIILFMISAAVGINALGKGEANASYNNKPADSLVSFLGPLAGILLVVGLVMIVMGLISGKSDD
jgi:hypothetical protein